MRGIKHFANLALQERNMNWGYDTCIRDNVCLVSQSCVETALMLLSDCVYDEDREYWLPSEKGRFFVRPLLIYKFWAFQTGRGLVRGKSKVDKRIKRAQESDIFGPFEKAFAKELDVALNGLEQEWAEVYRPIAETDGPCFEEEVKEIDEAERLQRRQDDIKKSYNAMVSFFGAEYEGAKDLAKKYDFLQ